jgi:hypothetical protein
MKLYKLLEEIILEEINKHRQVLTEGVSVDDINLAINGDDKGRHYHVSFDYRDNNGELTSRWVQIYDYVNTTANNDAISAYEVSSKGNGVSKRPGWKIFRLDRMNNFKLSKVPFYKPISDVNPSIKGKFNPVGNNTPTISGLNNKAKFDYQYKDSIKQNVSVKPPIKQEPVQVPLDKQVEPVQQQQQQQPNPVRPMNRIQPNQKNMVPKEPKNNDLEDENNDELNKLK